MFEHRVAHGQTHTLARCDVSLVGARDQGQSGQRRRREVGDRESGEEIGRDLLADLVDLLPDELGLERSVVDELERPCLHDQAHVVATELGAPLDEPAQPDVGERATHIGEHLDDGHDASLKS